MALARSASGPGGLSINTGSANLFGSNTSQPPAAGGLFGSAASKPAQSGSLFGTATSQPQAGTSLFGTTAATTQPQQSGSLFGMNTAQKPQSSAGGLFGTAPAQQAQQTTGGGLFGGTTATQPQTQQAGGLFGTATAQPQQQTGGLFGASTTTQQPAQTGGLFGTAAPQTQPAQGGGLFGAATAQAQPAQGGGLFGQSTQTQPAQGGGLFGQTAQQQPAAATGGLFGTSTPNTSSGMFGQSTAAKPQGGLLGLGQSTNPAQQAGFGQSTNVGLTMGQSVNQQSQMVPGVRIDVSNIRPTTRFNDLQEDLQKQIAAIDEGIQKCIRDKEAVDAFLPAHGEQLFAIPVDVSFVTRKSDGANASLSSDIAAINQLRDLVRTDVDNARLSFKAVDNLRLPTQYHQAGLWSTRSQQTAGGAGSADDSQSNGDLISFFSKTADEMEEMMKKFERNLGEIEVHMTGVQSNLFEQLQRVQAQSKNGTQGGVDERLLELQLVLQEFEQSILKVAGVVGGIKEGVTELQLKDFMGHGS